MGEQRAIAVGDGHCFDLRGPDFETLLVGAVTPTIIDADRLVRLDWANGLPNWTIYRVVLAQDSHLRGRLRDACVGFAVAYCRAGGIRKQADSESVGCLAGWDAFNALTKQRWVITGEDIEDVAGVDPKTYRRVRSLVYRVLRASMAEYWVRMQVAIRQVALMEKRQEQATTTGSYSLGTGFERDGLDVAGNGNFIAPRRGSGC